MSHFVGAVIIPASVEVEITTTPVPDWTDHTEVNAETQAVLTRLLEKFNENREVEPYIENADSGEALARARKYYEEHDPSYLVGKTDMEILNTDWSEGWREEDGKLVRYTTYNPDSKWDWYQVGGRWGDVFGKFQLESIEAFRAHVQEQIDAIEARTTEELAWFTPFNVVVPQPDGDVIWINKGNMGWWGITTDEADPLDWSAQILKATEHITDAKILYVDFHI